MLLTMMATTGTMWGQTRGEEVYSTCLFGGTHGTSGNYTSTWTATNGDFSWSVANGNTNNSNWNYVKFGRKNVESVGTVTTASAYTEAITKVDVTIDAITASNVNSIKLYTSSNGSSWTEAGTYTKATGTKSVSLTSPTANLYYKVEFDCASGSANGLVTVSKVEFYHNTGGNPTVTTPEITPDGGSFLDSQEVSISCATTGATIYYTTDGSTPSTTSTQYTTPFTINETTTVKAYAVLTNYDDSQVATATFTKATALTVAEAIAATPATGTSDYVYISGIVSAFYNTSIIGDGSNYRYYISDDGTTTNQLLVYKGNGLNNDPFANVNDLLVNDHVIIYGKLTTYNNTKEVAAGNYIYSLERPTVTVEAPTFSPEAGTYAEAKTVTMSCTTDGATIHYTTDGTEPDGNSNVYSTGITVSETTTFKAKAIKGDDASNVVTATYHINSATAPYTVSQALGFADYQYPANGIYVSGIVSTAPTAAPNNGQLTYYISDNGEATNQLQVYKGKDLDNTAFTSQDDIQVGDIVTVYGNVVVYGTSNPIKEFAQGNYLTSFERPTPPVVPTITVNPTSVEATAAGAEGTLTVTYTAIETDLGASIYWYTDNTGNTTTDAPEWIEAEINATTLNVDYLIDANTSAARTAYMKVYGLDTNGDDVYSDVVTISQAAYVAPVASITIDPTTVNATAAETDGTLTVTYTNITTVAAEVYFCDANGDAATYDWIEAEINNDNNVDYTIGANTGAARTAYLKVWAYADDATTEVYSELVTINQAAGATPPTPSQYDWIATTLANLTSDDVFVIVGDNGDTYAMANNNGTSKAPATVEVTIANNKITSSVGDTIQWKLSGNSTNGYTFYPNGSTTTWLYCNTTASSSSNNNMRVGTGSRKVFEMNASNYLLTKDDNTTRYLSIYNDADWRGYVNTDLCPEISFYKRVPASTEPSITLNQHTYNLNADGGQAELPVVYNNMPADPQAVVIFYESDGVTPLTENPTWITATINGNNNVNGIIQANTGEARSAYFKVKGIDADNNDVYSDLVTINQAAYVLSIVFETTELDIEVGGEQNRVLSFEYQGFGQNPTFEVRQYDATGQTQTTYEWLTTTITQGHKVNITVAANTGSARSGYFKVYGTDGTVNTESNLVTINQAEYVAPTYTVTYNANGGTGTMTDPNSPYTENTQVTLLENTFTAPEGKIWDSWLVKDADQTTIAVNNNTFTMPASNVTVTAQWVDDPYAPTYEWVLTALEDLTSNDVFVIVGNNGSNYAMTNDNGTTSAPATAAVIVANNKLTNAPANNLKWNLEIGTNGYTFYPNGVTNKWLYCTDANNGLRVGTEDNKVFAYEEVTITDKEGYYLTITPASDKRYVCIYNNSDWRSYKSGSIVKTDTKFYKRQVASTDPQLSANDVDIESDVTAGEITYTLENAVQGGELTAEITAGNEGEWLTLGAVGATVPFTCEANNEQTERTATVTLTYTYNETSISATAVVTQAALIIDYATMPFAFDGGRADIENVNGLTQEGLDSDYGSSPKLKFNTTGDWMVLKLNAKPVSIIYDIKGNSFSGGTFSVQVSENGVDYEDLEVYDELGDVQTDTIINTNDDVRYIKWIYTSKFNGNVALGNIQVYDVEFTIINNSTTIPDLTIADGQAIVVNTDVVLELTGTVTNPNPANLIVREGGQLIHTSDVQATLQKEVAAYTAKDGDGWYLIASPVEPLATSVVAQGTYDLFTYDEEHAYWYSSTGATAPFTELHRGQGYLYANASDVDLNYAGTMKATNYNMTVDLSYTSSLSTDVRGFNLVGNPFTRNLVLGDMKIGTNPLTTFYVINTDRTGLQAITSDAYQIKPGEGFFVQATAASQQLSFNPSSKDEIDFRYIKIVAGNEAGYDNAYIQFGNCNTLRKMNIANKTEVYVMDGDDDYAAARVEELAGTMPIHFEAVADGEYTITIEAKHTDAHYMHLLDNFTGADIDLLVEPSYTFNATTNDNADRFRLVFDCNNYTSVDENYTSEIFAYQNGSDIYVNGNGELQIFDVMGRMVATQHINGVQTINVKLQGVYIFRLNDNTQKIVVR